MLSLSGCKCQCDTAPGCNGIMLAAQCRSVLIIMIMREEIRPMQMQGRVSACFGRRASRIFGPSKRNSRPTESLRSEIKLSLYCVLLLLCDIIAVLYFTAILYKNYIYVHHIFNM